MNSEDKLIDETNHIYVDNKKDNKSKKKELTISTFFVLIVYEIVGLVGLFLTAYFGNFPNNFMNGDYSYQINDFIYDISQIFTSSINSIWYESFVYFVFLAIISIVILITTLIIAIIRKNSFKHKLVSISISLLYGLSFLGAGFASYVVTGTHRTNVSGQNPYQFIIFVMMFFVILVIMVNTVLFVLSLKRNTNIIEQVCVETNDNQISGENIVDNNIDINKKYYVLTEKDLFSNVNSEEENDEAEDFQKTTELIINDNLESIKHLNRLSFEEKLEKLSEDVQNKYFNICKEILSYGIKYRISNRYVSFRRKCVLYFRINIAGKKIKLYCNIDPSHYDSSPIPIVIVSNKKSYEHVPTMIKIKSELSYRRAIKLIQDTMNKHGISKVKL